MSRQTPPTYIRPQGVFSNFHPFISSVDACFSPGGVFFFFLVNPHFLLLFRGRVVVLWQRTDSVTVGYDTSVEMIFVSGHLIGKVYGVFFGLTVNTPQRKRKSPQCVHPPLSTAQPAVRDSQPPKKWLFLTEEINLFVIPTFNLFCNKII